MGGNFIFNKKGINMYQHIRLWFWWNYIIKRDEFSHKLGYWYLYKKHVNKKPNYSCDKSGGIIIRHRNLAHDLDNGDKISDINPELIKLARI